MVQKLWPSLLLVFFSLNCFAQQGAVSTSMKAYDAEGNAHNVRAFSYKNEWNRPEVRIESADLPRIAPGVNTTLGYGRDFDDDGKIESWFMYSYDQGLIRITLPGNHPLGYDVIQHGLFSQYHTSALMEANVFFSAIVSYVSMAASRVVNSQKTYFKEMLDYEEISVRLSRSQGMSLEKMSAAQVGRMRLLLYEGYRRSYDKMKRGQNSEFIALLAADVGLWLSGGVVVKYLGKGMKLLSGFILKTPSGAFIKKMISQVVARSLGFIAKSMHYVQRGLGTALTVAQIGAVKLITNLGLKNALSKIGRGLIIRGQLAADLKIMLAGTKKFLTSYSFTAASIGASMWGDLRAETVRKEEPTRLVQTLLHSAQVENDIVQCATNQKTGGKVQFKIKGLLNFDQKTLTVMREQDYRNVAYDIGSKLAIDNAKDTMNTLALNYIENIVVETRQPKLMVMGYLVIVANEVGSNQVKNKFQPSSPILCPIRAERD